MSTVTRGRFGVTRDTDGSLASIYYWPWYWRYPTAVLGLFATGLVVGYLSSGRNGPLVLWFVGIAGAFISLSVAYELLVLGLFVAIVMVPAKLASSLFPDVTWGDVAPYVAIGFGIYVVTTLRQILKRLDALQQQQRSAHEMIGRIWMRQEGRPGPDWVE